MESIISFIKELFYFPKFQDHLETFVSSKNPRNTAEVEYWIQYYNQNVQRIGQFWLKGGLDRPLFFVYNGVIMKVKTVPMIRKVRVITNGDVYYTDNRWETKEIEGVKFIYVIKNIGMRDIPKLMRRDSLEYLKWYHVS